MHTNRWMRGLHSTTLHSMPPMPLFEKQNRHTDTTSFLAAFADFGVGADMNKSCNIPLHHKIWKSPMPSRMEWRLTQIDVPITCVHQTGPLLIRSTMGTVTCLALKHPLWPQPCARNGLEMLRNPCGVDRHRDVLSVPGQDSRPLSGIQPSRSSQLFKETAPNAITHMSTGMTTIW